MTPTKSVAPKHDDTPIAISPVQAADALVRAAVEACRQHERVGRLLAKGSADDELLEVAELCDACLRHLAKRTTAYESAAAAGKGKTDDALWHAANALWHSSRDYARRHHFCDSLSGKSGKHSSDHFATLHTEYELEASALLALRNVIATYRKLRPEVE